MVEISGLILNVRWMVGGGRRVEVAEGEGD
jgi:hypothetical protein